MIFDNYLRLLKMPDTTIRPNSNDRITLKLYSNFINNKIFDEGDPLELEIGIATNPHTSGFSTLTGLISRTISCKNCR